MHFFSEVFSSLPLYTADRQTQTKQPERSGSRQEATVCFPMATAVVTAPVVAARGQVSSLKFFLSFAKFLFGFGGKAN